MLQVWGPRGDHHLAKCKPGRGTGIFCLHENLKRPLCEAAWSFFWPRCGGLQQAQDTDRARVWLVPGTSFWGWQSHNAIKARLKHLACHHVPHHVYTEEGKVRGMVKEDIIWEVQQGAHRHLDLQPVISCPKVCAGFTSLNIKTLWLPELANTTCGSAHMKLARGPAALGVGMGLAKVSSSQLTLARACPCLTSMLEEGGGCLYAV